MSKQEDSGAALVFDDYPEFHREAMGCGLEDRGIRDRYDAMEYGWNEAMERVAERIDGFIENLNPNPAERDDSDPTGAPVLVGALELMEAQGGSFVKALAGCFYAADPANRATLRASFAQYFEQYEERYQQSLKATT